MIAVVDYNMGNLRSVAKALELAAANLNLNDEIKVTSSPDIIASAGTAIILPGVGAFKKGMENLEKLDLTQCIIDSINKNIPFLGICLGMQLLFTKSQEHGTHKGLDVIKGEVKKFDHNLKTPHMGWNQINYPLNAKRCPLFNGIDEGSYFYFVHSYFVEPEDKSLITTATDYGIEFTSSVRKNNAFGTQFHPEKSGDIGLNVLENFLKLCSQKE